MKFLTTNFVRCAVKSCDGSGNSFPLQYEDCQLQQEEQEFNPDFIVAMVERLDWDALVEVAAELGNTGLPQTKPAVLADDEQALRQLHTLLLETQILEGRMICKNCGHIYYIKDSIPNFLLPPHLAGN